LTEENQQEQVTLITAVRDCREETDEFLASLRKHEPAIANDLVLVDDGSGDSTRDYLRSSGRRYGFRILRNEHSRGFAFANNRGVAAAKSEWLLFMNNDLVLTKDWFAPFKQVILGKAGLAEPGCIGNVQIDPRTEKIDHAGVSFASGVPRHFLQGESEFPKRKFSEFLAVTGACFMIRRDLFLEVGGFDETYRTGFEDIDLCLRLRMLGFRHYVANQSRIYHKRGSSSERNEHQAHNSKVFYGRWGKLITRFEEWDRLKSTNKKLSAKERKIRESLASSMEVRGEGFLFSDFSTLLEVGRDYLRKDLVKCARRVSKLLELNFPEEARTWELSGVTALRMKKMKDAKASFSRAVQYEPFEPKHHNNLGEVYRQTESFVEAIRHFREALKLSPVYAKAHHNLGLCKLGQGKPKEAEKAFRHAVLFDPGHTKAWRKLGVIREEKGLVEEAMAAFGHVLRLNPKEGKIRERLAALYESANRLQEALVLLQVGAKLSSLGANGLLRGGRLAYALGRFEQAEGWLLRCVKSDGLNWEGWHYLGNVRVGKKDFAGAVLAYDRALEIQPEHPPTFNNLANCRAYLCDWSSRADDISTIETFRKREDLQVGAFEVGGLQLSEKEETDLAKTKAKDAWGKTRHFRDVLSFRFDKRKPGKKRIGFLSSDLRNHAVGHLFLGLVQNLDTEKFETFVYSTSPDDGSEVRKAIIEASGAFRELFPQPFAQRARMIYDDDLDLLVDLGGFSMGNNAELLALHPARRQAQFLGYASSMGKGLVDFMIGDRVVVPPSSSKFYPEKILRMDGCFLPPGDFDGFAKRVKRKDVGLPSKGFVFCAFHAAYKLDPDVWSCWMRVLKAVPESVLWLKFKPSDDAMKNLKAEAVRQGVSSKRIILAEDLHNRFDHLSRLAVADLYLDCPQYNGHASAMDALHAKLPVLTIKGNRFCNRVGESLVKSLGLSKMVARDLNQYEKKAIELGRRPSLLLPLRKKIQENAEQVLSPSGHARRFELSLDEILAMPLKLKSVDSKIVKAGKEVPRGKLLKDFTLVMVRPLGVTNWASNVSMLAEEAGKYGGKTLVIENDDPTFKTTDFQKRVHRLKHRDKGFSSGINQALAEVKTKFCLFLDDPLRALPVSNLIACMHDARKAFERRQVGYLGIGSSMEPNAGCLVTYDKQSNKGKVAGLFSPAFALNVNALERTGGFREFNTSLALSCLDLSLRMESQGYSSLLVESKGLLCPSRSGKNFLQEADQEILKRFEQAWSRKPLSLKPKCPPQNEQVGETPDYQEWIRLCDTLNERDLARFRDEAEKLERKPLISVIMPVYNPPRKFLKKAIESVLSQAYENWELCIADDASTKKFVRPLLEKYAGQDSRIKVAFRKTNGHISLATNSALKLAKGEYVAFFDHDDELRPHSLLEVVMVINENPEARLIYSDEDKIDEEGERYDPYFKPDWNPDLFLGQNYISHFSVIKHDLVKSLGGLRKGFEGAQDWDLLLRLVETIDQECILHIPKILYHWRASGKSTARSATNKSYVLNAARKCLSEVLARRDVPAVIECSDEENSWWRIKYHLSRKVPLVSILIPTKDRIDLLEKCLTSIRRTTDYPNMEIIVLDNDSLEIESLRYFRKLQREPDVSVIKVRGDFNYPRINNIGAKEAKGELLLLLNNDVEAIEKGWFEEMVSHALRPKIGCVGAKLLYPDDTIQHAGVIVGLGGGAGHAFKHTEKTSKGYSGMLSLVRNYSAVTAACLMVRKAVYEEVGGLDEELFKVAFNDVDFCLRICEAGYRNLWTPYAELYHRESVSRGNDNTPDKAPRAQVELNSLRGRWFGPAILDPCYNPNLSSFSESFLFGLRRSKTNDVETRKLTALRSTNVSCLNQNSIYDSGESYRRLFRKFCRDIGVAGSVFKIVGGKSKELGEISVDILKACGLQDNHFLVDVGCGYGRLAEVLKPDHKGKYLGTDVVPELLNHANSNIGDENWLFQLVEGLTIPVENESVDMVCFFSVFTHLLHEQSFKYLKEVKRVLKDGGKVVFTFLDFYDPVHTPHFEASVSGMDKGHPLNVFMNADLIKAWTELLGFECNLILGANEKKFRGYPFSNLGQSIACLAKPKASDPSSAKKHQSGESVSVERKTSLSRKGFFAKKKEKKKVLREILNRELNPEWKEFYFDCMPEDADSIHGIIDTENISAHAYDGHAIEIIESLSGEGLVLDCGAGKRPTYYVNVINFDPVPYETTDVVGVGEMLPFKDASFEAVFSLNVLEHVRDPFRCAKEIARVLKPGGKLYCVVPFMSPYHGYPDHYYNMTASGLANLFRGSLEIERQDVIASGLPIFSLTWILRNWADGLSGESKSAFLSQKVEDLIGDPESYLDQPFVRELSREKNFELGATTALWGKKLKESSLVGGGAIGQEGEEKHRSSTGSFQNRKYKQTWTDLSSTYEVAKLHVTGDATESELRASGKETIDRINESIVITKSDVVLEIGCGIGRIGRELASKCRKWIGCDISPNMLKYARKRLVHLKNIELIELPESNLSPIEDSYVDVVYCSVVFMHLDEWDRFEYVREAFRVLKPGGRAYFDNFSINTEEGWRIFKSHHGMSERPSHISKSSTAEELGEYLKRSNFIEVRIELQNPWVVALGAKPDPRGPLLDGECHKSRVHSHGIETILSLHIPKSGGTSFKNCLSEIYGESFLAHYPHLSKQGTEDLQIFDAKTCIHGHLCIDRYIEILGDAKNITWLRCPIERTISLYHHILNSPDMLNDFHKLVFQLKPSLLEFAELDFTHNQLFYWIGDRSPEDFKFIGFLETEKASIAKCATALGWPYVPKFAWTNKNAKSQSIQLSAKDRKYIEGMNQEELNWQEKARKIFG